MATASKTVIGGTLAAVLALAGVTIAKWEGVRYEPYQDIVGVWTVCYGHTGPDVVPGKKYTKAECDALLQADMAEANSHVRRCIPVPMLRQVEASFTSLVFNVGPRGACGSTIQKRALANDWPGACEAISMWNKAGGRTVRGLTYRRADELKLCRGY